MGLTRIRAEQISDIDYKQAVRAITLTDITLAGGAPAEVDGVSLVAGDRILVAGQSNAAQNGLYQVQTLGTGSNGTWTRTSDGNEDGEIQPGMVVMVTQGNQYADTPWKLVTNGEIEIGTTELTFAENYSLAFGNVFANGTAVIANTVSAGITLTAGENVTIVGNNTTKSITISSTGGGGNVTVSSTPPVSPNQGDVWIDADTAVQYLYFDDGNSNQWAEMEAYQSFSSGGSGSVDLSAVAQDIIPSANATYSLGNATNRWSNLFLVGNTIYLGEASLSSEGEGLLLPSQVSIGNSTISSDGAGLQLPAQVAIGTATIDGSSGGIVLPANSSIGGAAVATPRISSLDYPGDDTAADPAGGQTIGIVGTGFQNAASVIIDGATVSVVTFVSDTRLEFTSSAKATGSYTLYVINPDGGTGIFVPGMQYSGVPTWSSPAAGSLGEIYETQAISNTFVATSDSAVTYSLQSGTLPPGSTLNSSTGTLSGTANLTAGNAVTYNFTIRATDAEQQDTDRSFSLTIDPDVITWIDPTDGGQVTVTVDAASTTVLDATSAVGDTIDYSANALPTGLTLTGNTIAGTATVTGETSVALTATGNTTTRSSTITVTFVVELGGDPFFNSVSLLLSADVANTFITDTSTNSFTITPAGDTRPSAFSPYNTNWSNYFDGSGDYFTLASNLAFDVVSNPASVECWVYFSVAPVTVILNGQNSGAGSTMRMGVWGSTFRYTINDDTLRDTGITPVAGRWYHLCLTITGGVARFFIDGVLRKTDSGLGNVAARNEPYYIMSEDGSYVITGYMSNFRFCNGSIPTDYQTSSTTVGETIFSVPASALTTTSQGATSEHVKILTCQSNGIKDNSTNNFTITRYGDVRVTGFGPFTETDTATGSGYFDGTGDRLTIPSPTTGLSFGTGEFTIEFWVYKTVARNEAILDARSAATASPWFLGIDVNNYPYFYDGSTYTSTTLINLNAWNHVAVLKTSGVLKIFVNGVQGYSASYSVNLDRTAGLVIGDTVHAAAPLTSYLSNLRIVKGTAVYTSNFTPPTSPLTAISGTSLLTLQSRIGYNNSQPVDESGVSSVITRNGNASVGSYSPFTPAGWSGYFDGSGDYLSIPDNAELDFGTGDFTLEVFAYFNSISADMAFVGSTGNGGYDFLWRTSTGLNIGRINTAFDNTFAWTPSVNVWYHIAYCRSGTDLRVFVDGTQIGSTVTNSIAYNCVTTFIIGSSNTAVRFMNGYLSNLRMVKGTALYTANFTPPTQPLEPVAGTSLLTLRDPQFQDDGPNRFVITRAGDTSIQPWSPFEPYSVTPDSYAVYFDGTDDYFTIPDNANLQLGTEDFTAEGWFYPTKAGTIVCFYTKGVNTTGGIIFGVSTTQIFLRRAGTTDSVATVSLSGWNHIAWVRNSGTMSVYLNGVSQTITNPTSAFDQTDTGVVTIGSPNTIASAANRFGGYASNFRIIKGTALYTSDFTPSTTPLTNVSNTQLLVCQSPTIIDNSDNQWPITVVGGAQPIQYNPFGETVSTGVAYTPSLQGGSMYFDGTGDYLTSTTIPALVGDFTIEGWIYPMWTPTDAYKVIFSTNSTISGFVWGTYGSGALPYLSVLNGGSGLGTMNLAPPNNVLRMYQWQHIAMVRSNGVIRQYHNGVPLGSATTSTTFTPTTFSFGSAGAGSYFQGYISNFTINVGTAFYTSAFVPPAAPPTPVKGTTLLLNGTSGAIVDSSARSVLEAVGTARSTNSEKKYGTGSILINSTSNAFKTNGVLLPGDFTIEGWFKGLQVGSENFFIHQGINVTNGFLIGLTTATIRWRSNGQSDIAYAIPGGNSDWYHFAIVRNGSSTNNVKFYYNGTQVTQGTYTNQILPSAGSLFIGPGGSLSASFASTGYLDDFRITAGVARYTENFTPPTAPFSTQ